MVPCQDTRKPRTGGVQRTEDLGLRLMDREDDRASFLLNDKRVIHEL